MGNASRSGTRRGANLQRKIGLGCARYSGVGNTERRAGYFPVDHSVNRTGLVSRDLIEAIYERFPISGLTTVLCHTLAFTTSPSEAVGRLPQARVGLALPL